MQPSPEPSVPAPFSVTDSAAARVAALLREEGPEASFRIEVRGGGCSGFQYHYDISRTAPGPADIVIRKDGAMVVIDDISIGMLAGSQLDYVETLGSAEFEIKNPNATARCGCGNSFSV